jgi:hypothetical protein
VNATGATGLRTRKTGSSSHALESRLDAKLVKRPEIEAANRSQDERITTLSTRMNAIQAQVDALFPPSKLIDELWSGLRELRAANSAAKAPP